MSSFNQSFNCTNEDHIINTICKKCHNKIAPIKELCEIQTVAQLREIAKKMNLTGYSKLKKKELIDFLISNNSEEKDNDIKMNDNQVFYGIKQCDKCNKNKAYWFTDRGYLCGVCSKTIKERKELPKNEVMKTQLRDAELAVHNQSIIDAMTDNAERKIEGKVSLTKLYMMKNPMLIPGVMYVFPNFKHKNRKDGLGIPSLSPMSMGPIIHNQPGLPPSKCLENMWHWNKCFIDEVDDKGNIKKEFFQTQIKGYEDPIPHRHKKDGKPLFSVWKDKNGKIHRLSYVESRQIYCHYYMLFAMADENFIKLKKLIESGYNISICGYDANEMKKTFEEEYLSEDFPFGHECVLMVLLTSKEIFPWVKYKTLYL